jgi:PKD repeat protein
MSIPKVYVIFGALITLIVVGIGGAFLLQPSGGLISDVGFSEAVLTPNADGESDIVVFSYSLSRTATVSLAFENEQGQTFVFRDEERRAPGDYSVNFSGVVDGYRVDGEPDIAGDIERRLIPDGNYTWTFTATNDEDGTVSESGTLRVQSGDAQLPEISAFDVFPIEFSPNQDGINDRISVNVFLEKASDLTVYLEDGVGTRIYLAERLLDREPGEPGNHEFDYDGGVDDGFEPPEDGRYMLYAVAQDEEGQRVARTREIEIVGGGLPQVEIAPQPTGANVCFSTLPWDERYRNTEALEGAILDLPESNCSDLRTIEMLQGDLLVFRLTVRNYGRTAVRTHGPFAGTVYQYEQLPPALSQPESDGAVRVGIHCQASTVDNPWRWGLGRPDDLTARDVGGRTFYYLEAGEIVQVWGAIRMTEIVEERNPQNCNASLIHEGVRVFNRNVGNRQIELFPRELDE